MSSQDCKMNLYNDLLDWCAKIDKEIGGTELAQCPVPVAKLVVGLKKRIQDILVESDNCKDCEYLGNCIECKDSDTRRLGIH